MGKAVSLRGKVAVVTGGSSGIGAAAVRLLAEEGATVAVGYHSGKGRAEQLIAELPGFGHSAVALTLEDPASIQAAARNLGDRYGRVDILVNSAGFTQPVAHADLSTMDEQLFQQILSANVVGPFSVIRSLMPMLQQSDEAVVVNVSSISAFTGSGSNIAYCASKAALDTMTMSLARAFGPRIRFLSVSPGAVATDFVAGRDRAALEKAARSTPLQRVVEAEDVGRAILACVMHLSLSTGVRVVVDGGRHL